MPVTIEICVGAVTSRFTCDGDVVTLFQLFLAHPLSEQGMYEKALRQIHRLEGATAPEAPPTPPVAPDPHPVAHPAPEVARGPQKVARRADLNAPRPAARQAARDYDDGVVLACLQEMGMPSAGRPRIQMAAVWPAAAAYGVAKSSCRDAVRRLEETGEVVRIDQRAVRLATAAELAQRPDRPLRLIERRATDRPKVLPAPTRVSPDATPAPAGFFPPPLDRPVDPLPPPMRVSPPAIAAPAPALPEGYVAPAVSSPIVRTIQERRADIRRVLRDILNDEARCGLKALQASVKADVEDATDTDVEFVLNTLRNENQIGVITIGTERTYSRRPTVDEIV